MEQRKIESLDELHKFAEEMISSIEQKEKAYVIGLSGELGTGKTALTKEVGKVLSIEEEITSPTFVVMKSYKIPSHDFFKTLVHIDAYRLESDREMEVLRFKELLEDKSNLIVIEWPENIKNLLPEGIFNIQIEIKDGEERKITYGS